MLPKTYAAEQYPPRGTGLITAQEPNVTRQIAEFALKTAFEDIPEPVMELGKKSILDGVGLAIFGSTEKTAHILEAYFSDCASPNGVTVIGRKERLKPRFAAFTNGVAMHVSDYDDTQLAVKKDRVYGLLTHPTTPVLPAVLALGETNKSTGKQALTAYHVGVEVECKIAEAISPRHYEDGFHTTGTCGVFGSVTAAGRIRGFSVEQLTQSMGIAASQGAGLRENFGTMMKPFHAGHSAEVGVLSTDLAAAGWTGADHILEAPRGFFKAFGGAYDETMLVPHLGKPWTFANPGVSIKPFPSGSLTHPAMGEFLHLIQENDIKPQDVTQIEVGTNKQIPNAIIYHQPTNSLQAKFSMEFCIAILLLERKAGLAQFKDEVVNRPDVKATIAKIKFGVDPIAEAAGYDKMTSIIKIHLKNGKSVEGRADFAKGGPGNPMSYAEVGEKFMGCCDAAKFPAEKGKKIIAAVERLESFSDIREFTALCV